MREGGRIAGREGDRMMMGLSPRTQNLTLYVLPGLDTFAPLLKKLGPHSRGGSCLYMQRLEVLETILTESVAVLKEKSG
jgi:hypothetical protein